MECPLLLGQGWCSIAERLLRWPSNAIDTRPRFHHIRMDPRNPAYEPVGGGAQRCVPGSILVHSLVLYRDGIMALCLNVAVCEHSPDSFLQQEWGNVTHADSDE